MKTNFLTYNLFLFTLILIICSPFALARAMSKDELIYQANLSRQSFGINNLTENENLDQAAQKKAEDMLEKGYFSHNTPTGQTPWDFIKNANYSYIYAGENLAIGYDDSKELNDAWMNSLTHRENILNANFNEIGLAVVSGKYHGVETTVTVEMFGTQTPKEVKASNTQLSNSKKLNSSLAITQNRVLASNADSTKKPYNPSYSLLIGLAINLILLSVIFVLIRKIKKDSV